MTTKETHQSLDLPPPKSAAVEHSERLIQSVRQALEQAGGLLSFADFMQRLLYEPGLGYYSAGSSKLGAGGDFITAPEVSSLFSGCLAVQIEQVLANLESPVVMEVGAGSGRMALDILMELQRREALPDQYFILELSADLRQRQQALLQEAIPDIVDRVTWLEVVPERPFEGVVIANELLDAMPVRRFKVKADQVVEQGVCWRDDRFQWLEMPFEPAFQESVKSQVPGFDGLAPGYCSEFNPAIQPWFSQISGVLTKGAVLLIDYGYEAGEYYHPDRHDGTLLCHYQHRAHADPFVFPGLQDITASVDFTAAADAALAAGFDLAGYTTQAFFLMASGLDELMQDYASDSLDEQLRLAQQVKTLTLPGEMGERFKVIGLSKGIDISMRGFELMDMSAMLTAGNP